MEESLPLHGAVKPAVGDPTASGKKSGLTPRRRLPGNNEVRLHQQRPGAPHQLVGVPRLRRHRRRHVREDIARDAVRVGDVGRAVVRLVVAPDLPVATWAAQPIVLGPSTGQVTPFVLGASVVPRVIDASDAPREPALAVLSARVHGNGPDGLEVIEPAFEAMASVDRALSNRRSS